MMNSYKMNTGKGKALQEFYFRIAKLVKEEREKRGLSQTEIANVIGKSQSQYSKKEQGVGGQVFSLKELVTLCDYFGIEICDLICPLMLE